MNYITKRLTDLRIAYEAAINYDYVPSKEEAEKLITDYLPKHIMVSVGYVESILEKYEGYSCGDITVLLIDLIDEL